MLKHFNMSAVRILPSYYKYGWNIIQILSEIIRTYFEARCERFNKLKTMSEVT
jgi:hypothetical protein